MRVKLYSASKLGMIFRTFTALLAAAFLPVAALAQAPEYQNSETVVHEVQAPSDDVWPFDESDLPVDPEYRFGVLDNGMRYIIRPNDTPKGQGMVQFWIDAGSVAEAENERGYAHFIEHMAFNGSTNVPEGEMVRVLEREGLAFGADTNASTGFDVTLYKLDLPRNDPALLDTALMLMRETASELTFDPEAVEREKGVILSERRVRDTYAMRNTEDNLQFQFPEARFAHRLPIGTIEALENADAPRLKDLWQRLYRPDNTAIIVIGDFDPDLVESEIREHFADWENPADFAAPPFGPVDYDLQGQTDIYLDPALSEQITAIRHGPWIERPDTIQTRRERLLRQIGYSIINRRLQRLARLEDAPFRGAQIGTSEAFEAARSTNLVVAAAEGEWRRGLLAAQEEYRQALEYGFTEAEVAEQVANLESAIRSNAAGAETRPNAAFVTGALTLLQDDQIPTTPQSALERFEAHLPEITPEAVLEALRADLVPLDNPLLRFTGRTAPEGGAEAIRAAWDEGMASALVERDEAALAEFAYQDFGEPGTIVSDEIEPLLGIRTITFANGLKLNLKQTDLQDDRIIAQLNVDGGEMLDTREDPLATAMVSNMLIGGLGAHSLDELQSILAGKQVGINISTEDETFRLQGQTTPGDLDMQLQLFAAAISDPGYRPDGEEQYRRSIANYYARLDATPSSALSNALGGIISEEDPRFSLQPEEDYLQLTFAQLREDISDRLANGAMELALVGDFDEQRAIDLVASTLGALPQRETAFREYAGNRDRAFTEDRSPRVLRHEGAEDQALIQLMWPTTDDEDFRVSQSLALLERLVRVKLTDTIREDLGQAYGVSVNADQSRTYPGYGTFSITAEVDVEDVDATRQATLDTLVALREAPPEEDLILRARAPFLEAYDSALKTNQGWMNLVDRAQSEPERIERFSRGKEQLQTLTGEELQQLALRYLDPEQRLEVVVLPSE